MVVFIAAGGGGNQAQCAWWPFESGTTMTAAMAATTVPSDRVSEGVALESLYFLGLILFLVTLVLNTVALTLEVRLVRASVCHGPVVHVG